ncbi:uncharacterized protein K444DRAFT_89729 [Hyaloscypha bicolor E]|uniref:Cora-domain-containing protein n=1 Tax=Hyaloscypha bicolor E TaxID=1095630 RepID=A0A2J6SXJ7_9HELO|nr:uncharacterized protein K444DRAFT_89729 [Hyaloscypha bicolor E]PMD55500.1 hypothetical protein K444DRAFT_89729 [Hyaloscypha bicolor E]
MWIALVGTHHSNLFLNSRLLSSSASIGFTRISAMDALCRTDEFTNNDWGYFHYPRTPITRPSDRCATLFRARSKEADEGDEGDERQDGLARNTPTISMDWLDENAEWFDLESPDKVVSILWFPRDSRELDAPSLRKIPISKALFQETVRKFHFHRALVELLSNGFSAFSRISCTIEDRPCNVYTLCVERKSFEHTALTITYFPSTQKVLGNKTQKLGSKTYALALGFNGKEIGDIYQNMSAAPELMFSPFTSMKIFLENEKKKRVVGSGHNKDKTENLIEGHGEVQTETNPREAAKDTDDPHELLQSYLEEQHLKSGLMAWKAELLEMKKFTAELEAMRPPQSQEAHPSDYLDRLVREYDVLIQNCELVLQTTSLAFQKDTAHLAREDARQMKTIAILTMIFLPGTFIAILMTIPEFDSMGDIKAVPRWSWYLILSLPLTAITLGIYAIYIYADQIKEVYRKIIKV